MKAIILLLLSCVLCFGQADDNATLGLACRALGSGAATANDDTESTGSYNPKVGSELVAIVINTKASAPDQPTVTGNSLVWQEVFDTNYISTHRMTVWVAKAGSGVTPGVFTASTTGVNQTGWAIAVCEVVGGVFTGVDGTNGIRQRINASGTGTTLTGTFGALGKRPLCLTVTGGSLNSTAYTVDAGWTIITQAAYNTPTTTVIIAFQAKNTDTTCAISHASSFTGCMVGLEFGQLGNFP